MVCPVPARRGQSRASSWAGDRTHGTQGHLGKWRDLFEVSVRYASDSQTPGLGHVTEPTVQLEADKGQ